jgi:hypothetical protein
MTVSRVLLMLMRVSAAVQIVLGIGFWTGHWWSLIQVHTNNGIAFVAMLWLLAIIALVQRRTVGLALFAIVWGFALAMLGFTQYRILAGSSFHWVVRVVHLAVGLATLGIAEKLVAARTLEPGELVTTG